MESSKLVNYLTNKCQSDQGSMVMECAHKYEKRGALFMSTLFVLVILGLNYQFIGDFELLLFLN
jgi:hypothetical protein